MSVMEMLARVLMLSLVPLLTTDNGLTPPWNPMEEPHSVLLRYIGMRFLVKLVQDLNKVNS